MTAIAGKLLPSAPGDGALSLVLENKRSALGPGQAALHDFLQRHGIGERGLYDAGLVFEELFINIVSYGFSDAAPHQIGVVTRVSDKDIEITFDDDGREFDPTAAAAPVLPGSIEDAKIGGLGIMLVRKAASAIHYQRLDGRNRLRVSIPRA